MNRQQQLFAGLACALLLLLSSQTRSGETTAPGLRDLWAAGLPAFGEYVRQLPQEGGAQRTEPYSVDTGRELAGNPLLDFAFLSLEQHYDAQSARNIVAGLRAGGADPADRLLVRIPPIATDGIDAARERVHEVLAMDVAGIVIPHIMSIEEARAAVSFFADAEVWSPGNPDGEVIAMLIVEDPEVFASLEEIADIPGYSALVCGIGSLTSALDGDRDAAEVINLRVLAASQRRGMVDLITVDAESVARRVEQGFLGLLAYGPESDEVIRLGRAASGR